MNERRELTTRLSEMLDLEALPELMGAQMPTGDDAEPYGGSKTKKLRSLWRAVRKRLWLIIAITLLVTAAGAVYIAPQPDLYVAQARVQVDLEQNPLLAGSSRGGQVVFTGPGADTAYFNTQLLILTSPDLLRRVVRTLDLAHNKDFRNPPQLRDASTWKSLKRMFGFGGKDANKNAPATTPISPKIAPPAEGEDMEEAERLAGYVQSIQ